MNVEMRTEAAQFLFWEHKNSNCFVLLYEDVSQREQTVKGTVPRDFRLLVFSWISLPQAPECTISAISIFFENLRRYSRLKVHHRCQRHQWQKEKPSIRKILILLFGHLWVAELTYINFCLQVHCKVSAAWYCCHYLPPVSTTLTKMVAKLATGVVDNGCAPWLANISAKYRKNSKLS